MNIGKPFWIVCSAALIAFVFVPPVDAQTWRLHQFPPNLVADFSSSDDVVIEQTFEVWHRGPESAFFVTVSAGGSGDFEPRLAYNGSGDSVAYNLYDSENQDYILKDLTANPSPGEVVSGSFPATAGQGGPWQRQSFTFAFVVPSTGGSVGSLPVAGEYTDTIVATLYQGTLGSYTVTDQQQTTGVAITVPPILDLEIVSSGGTFGTGGLEHAMNFGVLMPGAVRDADLLVRTNTVYNVALRSANQGVLAFVGDDPTSFVPFNLSVDGNLIDLSPETDVTIAESAPPTAEARYAIAVEIPDFGLPSEGEYEDVITVTVTAQ